MELGICIYDKNFGTLVLGKSCLCCSGWIGLSGLLGVGASGFDNLVRKSWYDETFEKIKNEKKSSYSKSSIIIKANILIVLNMVFFERRLGEKNKEPNYQINGNS